MFTHIILAVGLVSSPSAFDQDLPFALGTAIAYAEDCKAIGFQVGDPVKAMEALQSVAPDAVRPTLDAARIAAISLARAKRPNELLPVSMRFMADREVVLPMCQGLADSAFGSTMVRRPVSE